MTTILLLLACRAPKVESDVGGVDTAGADMDSAVDTDTDSGTVPVDDTGACTPARLYADADGDGFGDPSAPVDACPGAGLVTDATDCDDARADVNPVAVEVCDDVDQDCDGEVDEGVATSTRYTDADGDGLGDPDGAFVTCHDSGVTNADDCDDTDAGEPVHVEAGADDSIADGSSAAPYAHVQEGIDAARVCVHVHAGTYVEDVDFVGKAIEVLGVDGADVTVIEGTGAAPVVTFRSGEGTDTLLTGFTITGGGGRESHGCGDTDCNDTVTYYEGGGVYVSGAWPVLDDLVVVDNHLPAYAYTETDVGTDHVFSYGGGLFVDADASPVLTGVQILDNSASSGGGAWVAGYADFTNALFTGNVTDGWLGGGAITLSEGVLSLVNVTAYANEGNAAIFTYGAGQLTLVNSIVAEGTGRACFSGEATAVFDMSYSDAYGCDEGVYGHWSPWNGTGNVVSDPRFVDAAAGDFHLDAASPCVDAGNPDARYLDADGTTNDMGAFGGPAGSW